jgi:nucleotide-binding universal stress UspA family protein
VLGENIVIAWNCSTETARTVAFGMPYLKQAKQVVVLTVEGGTVPGPTGEEVAQHLRRNAIPATARTAAANGRSIGQAMLAEALALGADLMFKGAYTQSRLRQMIFGGATDHILTAATLPVFFAH